MAMTTTITDGKRKKTTESSPPNYLPQQYDDTSKIRASSTCEARNTQLVGSNSSHDSTLPTDDSISSSCASASSRRIKEEILSESHGKSSNRRLSKRSSSDAHRTKSSRQQSISSNASSLVSVGTSNSQQRRSRTVSSSSRHGISRSHSADHLPEGCKRPPERRTSRTRSSSASIQPTPTADRSSRRRSATSLSNASVRYELSRSASFKVSGSAKDSARAHSRPRSKSTDSGSIAVSTRTSTRTNGADTKRDTSTKTRASRRPSTSQSRRSSDGLDVNSSHHSRGSSLSRHLRSEEERQKSSSKPSTSKVPSFAKERSRSKDNSSHHSRGSSLSRHIQAEEGRVRSSSKKCRTADSSKKIASNKAIVNSDRTADSSKNIASNKAIINSDSNHSKSKDRHSKKRHLVKGSCNDRNRVVSQKQKDTEHVVDRLAIGSNVHSSVSGQRNQSCDFVIDKDNNFSVASMDEFEFEADQHTTLNQHNAGRVARGLRSDSASDMSLEYEFDSEPEQSVVNRRLSLAPPVTGNSSRSLGSYRNRKADRRLSDVSASSDISEANDCSLNDQSLRSFNIPVAGAEKRKGALFGLRTETDAAGFPSDLSVQSMPAVRAKSMSHFARPSEGNTSFFGRNDDFASDLSVHSMPAARPRTSDRFVLRDSPFVKRRSIRDADEFSLDVSIHSMPAMRTQNLETFVLPLVGDEKKSRKSFLRRSMSMKGIKSCFTAIKTKMRRPSEKTTNDSPRVADNKSTNASVEIERDARMFIKRYSMGCGSEAPTRRGSMIDTSTALTKIPSFRTMKERRLSA
ncbi:hypothetical protein MPSEU_000699200 [Mayamaea pseudoterrestris]|nr:hypothetical protein MPSEU_000699200 [Mayamaea pseudoterrestris]